MFTQEDLVANSLKMEIPYEFIDTLTNLDWIDLSYGLICGFISNKAAIEKAREQLIEDNSEIILSLACLFDHEAHLVDEYMEILSKEDGYKDMDSIKDKWLFICLSWLYENPNKYNLLYAEVEHPLLGGIYEKFLIIQDDFHFPKILKGYFSEEIRELEMPYEKYLEIFFEKWRAYLYSQRQRFIK